VATTLTLSELPDDPQAANGGRGPTHCGLAFGLMIGGALGSLTNPIVGFAFIRFGMIAASMHC
jgi:hypothetical protein